MTVRTLNIDGVPEPVAQALEAVTDLARRLAGTTPPTPSRTVDLPVWTLGVIRPLTREEIHDRDP